MKAPARIARTNVRRESRPALQTPISSALTAISDGSRASRFGNVLLLLTNDGDSIFLEVHSDAYKKGPDPLETILDIARSSGFLEKLDLLLVKDVIRKRDGVARDKAPSRPSTDSRIQIPDIVGMEPDASVGHELIDAGWRVRSMYADSRQMILDVRITPHCQIATIASPKNSKP